MSVAVADPPDSVRPAEEWSYYFEVIALDRLFVDKRYQRPLTNFWKDLRDDFRPAMVGTLVVGARKRGGGTFAVIDGQTRMEAMQELGLPNAPCLVYHGLTPQEEAELFADLQTKRRGMRTYDRFRAQLVARRPEAMDISRIVESEGFSLSAEEDNRTLKAIAALEKIYKRGPEHLHAVLTIISEAWGTDDRSATQAQMLEGISWVLLEQDRIDHERLVRRLREVEPSLLRHRASALREGKLPGYGSGMYVGQAILNLYMSRR